VKLTIELAGKTRVVELTAARGRDICLIDGVRLEADAVEIAPGTYSILMAGQSFEARVHPTAVGLSIDVGGQEYSATVRDPRLWRPRRGTALAYEGRQQVVAPMPGKVVRVLAKAGERIEAGQGLLVVEAMKMQNEVKSPKSGQIEAILVSEGQSVNAGELLATVA
jgi:biotin carboxyl carrier protein